VKNKKLPQLLTQWAGDKRTWMLAKSKSMVNLTPYQLSWTDPILKNKSSQKDIMNSQRELITTTIKSDLENEIYLLIDYSFTKANN